MKYRNILLYDTFDLFFTYLILLRYHAISSQPLITKGGFRPDFTLHLPFIMSVITVNTDQTIVCFTRPYKGRINILVIHTSSKY